MNKQLDVFERALEQIGLIAEDSRADSTLSVRNTAAIQIIVSETLNRFDIENGRPPRFSEAYEQQKAIEEIGNIMEKCLTQ